MWIGFMWLRIGKGNGLFEHSNEMACLTKCVQQRVMNFQLSTLSTEQLDTIAKPTTHKSV
jgi:hypothetical protein